MGVQVLVHVHTGTRIHWDAHQTFFCTKVRGRGGGGAPKQILREYGFKKTSKITDDPLGWPFHSWVCRFSNLRWQRQAQPDRQDVSHLGPRALGRFQKYRLRGELYGHGSNWHGWREIGRRLAELLSGYETGHCGRPAVGFVYIPNGKLVHFIFSLCPFSS